MRRRVLVVDGPLAYRMARIEAARKSDTGLEISTLPLLAARLAGGFSRIADRDVLSQAIAAALEAGGFQDIESIRDLPGMVRAVAQTFDRLWASDHDLDVLAEASPRLADLSLLQRRVRAALPVGVLLPRDARDAAIARMQFAPMLAGSVILHRLIDVDRIWRPLVAALAAHVDVSWSAVGNVDRSWFPGRLSVAEQISPQTLAGDICANPRSEVVEAMRWARELLTRSDVAAADIALAAASPVTWDEHVLVLSSDANLPVHFSHGVPALSTWEGQACAALADVLINGLSQDRIRRLLRGVPHNISRLIPADWSAGLPRRAGLFTIDQWRSALHASRDKREDPGAAERTLLPVLELLAHGHSRADEAGRHLLFGPSLGLWRDALRNAPAAAVALSLQSLRVRDKRDPGNSVVWCPAAHLSSAPRRFVRLIGLAGRAWPRSDGEDPLVPNHILSRRHLIPVSATERDRQAFEVIVGQTVGEIVVSRSQRSSEGAIQCASALWPAAAKTIARNRTRVPEHAFSQADRLLARSAEAGQSPHIKASRQCWRNWRRFEITPHDGAICADHPAVLRALGRLHSATSLKRLARDPLGFLWRYVLGMRAVPLAQQPLALDPLTFGELVHELLRRTVDALEPNPGFVRATRDSIESALTDAVDEITLRWPLERPVPPPLLWTHTLQEAARRCMRGLTADIRFEASTRSWTEVSFGYSNEAGSSDGPWPVTREILIGVSNLRLGGRIDRVDVAGGGVAVRLSDYKTGAMPPRAEDIIIDGGKELQRVLYAMAVRQLLPDATKIVTRLVFLDVDSLPCRLQGDTLDIAAQDTIRFLDTAYSMVRDGNAHPGPDARDRYNDLRLALPVELDSYFRRKNEAFNERFEKLLPLWSAP